VSQGFDIPLFTGSRGRLYGHLQRSATHRLDFTRGRVRAGVITAYAQLYARERQLRILERNSALYADFAGRAEKRYRAGEASSLEQARARAEHAASVIALEQGRRDHLTALTALSEAIGSTLPAGMSASDSLLPSPLDTGGDGQGLAAHPLLLAAREQYAGYEADASWRWMQYLPSFNASWFRQDFMDTGLHWGAELTAQVPLWFMFDTRGQNAEAGALARQAEAELRQTEIVLETRYRNAEAALEAADRAMGAYSAELLQEAKNIVTTARKSYDAGEIDYVEYIAAQQSANRTWLGYFDTLAAWYAAAADYELTTGRIILGYTQ
jgi:cobalt-zinc-cadmium resistance protein CzcA